MPQRAGPSATAACWWRWCSATSAPSRRGLDAFNRTGIAHLVSISGLHITMIAALVGGIGRQRCGGACPALLQRAPAQTAAIVAGVVAALLYALLAGWGIPAQRTV